jgi:hypothetical protein
LRGGCISHGDPAAALADLLTNLFGRSTVRVEVPDRKRAGTAPRPLLLSGANRLMLTTLPRDANPMISEERRIKFSKEAVIEALRLARNLGLPPGQIVELRAAADGGCGVQIRTGDGATQNVNLSPSQMAAVFIAFARTKRVPMPRQAQKQLIADGDGITMVIAIK